jgi:histidyl-tRNA synthetase
MSDEATLRATVKAKETTPISLQPPRGTHDILPEESAKWQQVEEIARTLLGASGYCEIRTPIFEQTELFARGVGDATDIVNKEMYTFNDKSDRSLTLRPEGTASAARAYLNGGMHRLSPPVKLWYSGPMFRYERTQKGRQRQFHTIAIEAFGSAGPLIDAEVILLGVDFIHALGINNFEIQLNSIGCTERCRPRYREALKEFLAPRLAAVCEDCRQRYERNPLRMLDCKSPTCQSQYVDAPVAVDYLCEECANHWRELLNLLDGHSLKIVMNKKLVRGLDYYTRTVFEFVSDDPRIGAQSSIGSGGRYDNLVEIIGGSPTPAVGWGMGIERLLLVLDAPPVKERHVFIVSTSQAQALKMARELRLSGIACELDFPKDANSTRNLSKQLQQANKAGADFVVIAGEEEIAANEVSLKHMATGSQEKLPVVDLAARLKILIDNK